MKTLNENNEYEHSCGCITVKLADAVSFSKQCANHEGNKSKLFWIAIQHNKE